MIRVRVIVGSESDAEKANIFLRVLKVTGIGYSVSVASCHRNAGELEMFVRNIDEKLIVFIGGMSLAAPGFIMSMLIWMERVGQIVFAVPLDVAARSAIEDLPVGTPVITCGLNTVSVTHSITNSALAVAHIASLDEQFKNPDLVQWYRDNRAKKPLKEKVELDENGLIPISKK
jgi:phosphoribosylcarboxyaminoimidazole (NCAIR) mutase